MFLLGEGREVMLVLLALRLMLGRNRLDRDVREAREAVLCCFRRRFAVWRSSLPWHPR